MDANKSLRARYYLTFGMLLVLLVATVITAEMHLGQWALQVCLLIAAMKVGLIAVVFMHLGQNAALFRIFVGAGLITCSLLFVLAGCDYLTRI